MSDSLVGVDLGTSGIKAGVVDESGSLTASSYWEAGLTSEGPGRMAQSPEDFTRKALRIVREVVEKAGLRGGDVKGISLDGQMGGVIGVDGDFSSLTGLDMGLDTRSEVYNERMHRDHAELLARVTCGSPRNTPKIIRWKRENRAVYDRVFAFVTLGGYTAGRMAGLKGEDAFIDRTTLAFFGNEDASACGWSPELSGLFGAGLTEPGDLIDVAGSSTILARCVEGFRPDLEHRAVMYMPSVLRGSYHAFTYINGGGICLRWFRDEVLGGAGSEGAGLYEEIARKAMSVPPGSGGLFFIPYFGGRQCPYDASLRGGWLGLNWGHRKEHLFRSMLESLAYDYHLGLLFMRELFPHLESAEVYTTGGGAQSGLWNRIKADVLGLPYRRLGSHQFALRGSALIAGFGLGLYGDLRSAARRYDASAEEEVIVPDDENHRKYARYGAVYRQLFTGNIEEIFRRLIRENYA
jgi:xylulokinase